MDNMTLVFDNVTFATDMETVTTDNSSLISSLSNNVETLRQKFNAAQNIICPVLLAVGVIGNVFTILTVTDSQFRRLTSRCIICALAVSDSLLLLTNPFNQQFILDVWKRDLRAISVVGCKTFFVAYRTGKMSASWFVVMVAIERFVAVIFPLHVKTILKKSIVLAYIGCVYMFMLCLTGIWTFSTDIVGTKCRSDVVQSDNAHMHKNFVIVGATFYSFAPIAILFSLTPPIIYKLVQQHRWRQTLSHVAVSALERSARETYRTSLMLIGIVLSYIVLVVPITLVLVLTFWTNEPFFASQKSEFVILSSVAQFLEQINHSSNFLIYVLFSSQFRVRFLQKVGCCKKEEVADSLNQRHTASRTLEDIEITPAENSSSEHHY